MRAAVLERRQDHLGGVGPGLPVRLLVVHQRPVIGVGDADVALAGRDVARDFAVAARRLLRKIGLDAGEPLLGLGGAVVADVGGEQRVVVDVLAGADADLALPLRVGEFLIGDRVLLHAILRGVDDARAHRDAVPMTLGIAELRRHHLVERLRLDRLRDAGLHRVFEAADVDRQQHVGGAVGTFGLDALLEAGACRDDVDLDAGVLGEGFEQRLDQLRFAIGVDVDLALRMGRSICDRDGRKRAERNRGGG